MDVRMIVDRVADMNDVELRDMVARLALAVDGLARYLAELANIVPIVRDLANPEGAKERAAAEAFAREYVGDGAGFGPEDDRRNLARRLADLVVAKVGRR